MKIFSDPGISIAAPKAAPLIVQLLNRAYRGESSRKGWTTEADLIAGDVRTDINNVNDVMELPGSVFLLYKGETDMIDGCVNLQLQGSRLYLGMFSVNPESQGAGIGKKLLNAAEEYAFHIGAVAIFMSVIALREELISWYKRHGYKDTGERKPFKEDGLSGRHLRELEFMILEKELQTQS